MDIWKAFEAMPGHVLMIKCYDVYHFNSTLQIAMAFERPPSNAAISRSYDVRDCRFSPSEFLAHPHIPPHLGSIFAQHVLAHATYSPVQKHFKLLSLPWEFSLLSTFIVPEFRTHLLHPARISRKLSRWRVFRSFSDCTERGGHLNAHQHPGRYGKKYYDQCLETV
ncbi:hypothetical protein BDV96DRAFT_36042 [Lophiotrema nucula]|uniref:Uncharacterized protein n=1 Tax=Lophiotrema nucula TaxID=690887 RepID=A0A6A5ZES1_9PLEO|nr:hypothetical protein BDV96DRAFT_36042 [Lophiotrema nucula]